MAKTLLLHIIIWLQEWITFRPFLKIKRPHIVWWLIMKTRSGRFQVKISLLDQILHNWSRGWRVWVYVGHKTKSKVNNQQKLLLSESLPICSEYFWKSLILYVYFSDMFEVFLKELRRLNMFYLPACHNSISVPFLNLLTICSKKLILRWFTNTSPLYGNKMPNIKILN